MADWQLAIFCLVLKQNFATRNTPNLGSLEATLLPFLINLGE